MQTKWNNSCSVTAKMAAHRCTEVKGRNNKQNIHYGLVVAGTIKHFAEEREWMLCTLQQQLRQLHAALAHLN